MKKFIASFFGVLVGVINGTIGAGGGLVAIPIIKKFNTPQKSAHSTAVAVLMPISAVSAFSYLRAGHVAFSDAAPFILPSVIGAVIGTYLLKKIPTTWLKRIFSVFMIYAGVRLLLK
jgi:uncharacterized membrane protein YfcA